MSQTVEAEAFLKRLSGLSNDPGTPLTSAIAPSLEDETALRRLFATERDHKRLQNLNVGLVDVFGASTDCIRNIRARQVKDAADLTDKYVMALDDKTRRKDGELAMASTFEDFKSRWAIFSEGALSQLTDWTGVVAAGGSVLACLAPLPDRIVKQGSKRAIRKYYHSEAYPASDIDLFLYGMTPEQAEEKCKAIFAAVRDSVPWEVTTVRTKNAVSIHCQYPYRSVQIVLRLYHSPAEILAGFDVDSSCVAFDGQHVLATPRAVISLITQSNKVAMDRRSPSYEVRLAKYAQRGFEIHIPELKREDVDPTIFERALSRVPGLARLLVLEKLSTQEARDKYLGVRRTMRGRPADPSNRYRRRDRRLKGDLKAQAEFGGLQMSDYDVAFHIPYGPGIDARKIEKMVYQTDLGMNSTFNPKNKGRTLHRHPAFFGTMEEAMEDCCEHCRAPETDEEKETFTKESEQFLTGRITFMQEDPGRQSMTGSFRPIDEGEWSDQAYIRPVTRLFTSIAAHDRAVAADFVKKNADSIKWRDHVGRTALQFAIQCSARDICKDLIQAGARTTARLVDGRSSLHLACQLPDMEDVVTAMLMKSDQTATEIMEREKAEGKKAGSDVEMKDDEAKVQDSSDDDWTDQEEHEENEDYSEAKKKVQPQPATGAPPAEDDVLEDTDEPDVLDVDAADWDQGMTPLGYAIISGSLPIVKILVEAKADCKTPLKARGYGVNTFHPLSLTALTKDESVAAQIAAYLVAAGGATSAAADEDTVTVFHRLVAYNRVETVATLLRVDPTAKTAARFLTPSWSDAVSPVVTAFAGGCRAMIAVLIAYAGSRVYVDKETFERSVAATPNPSYQLKQDDAYTRGVTQPLEVALFNRNDLYRLAIALEPDSARTSVPKQIYGYRQNADQRRSLLDLLRGNIDELNTLLAGTTPANDTVKEINNGPNYGSILDLEQMEISSKTGWEAEAILLEKQVVAMQKKRSDDGGAAPKQKAKDEAEKKVKAERMLSYYQDAVTQLEQIGAKTWNEIFPEEPSNWKVNLGTQDSSSAEPAKASTTNPPTRRYLLFGSHMVSAAGAHLTPLYDELFEAIWAGNTEKVEEMCLPPIEGRKPTRKDLLQVTAGVVFRDLSTTSIYSLGNNMYTTLFVALRARKWATAKAIMAIAKAQRHQDEQDGSTPWKGRIALENSDDEEDSDAESDDSAVTPTKLGFDTIAARFSTISVDVDPAELLSRVFYMPMDGVHSDYIQVITMAIYNDDLDMFKEICDLMSCLDQPQLPSVNSSILDCILKKDTPSILHEYIRRTGEGLALPEEQTSPGAETAEVDDEEDHKLYMGLNVHGKKRKDLAKQGDPNAPATVEGKLIPLLWKAASSHSLSIIDYLAGPQPLEAYKQYLSTATKPAKKLAAISDLATQLPMLLGFNINHLGESAVLATASSADTSDNAIETLKKLMARSPKLVATAINTQVKLQRITPLLAACGTLRKPELVDWLLSNGADSRARDQRGWNIYHLLCAYPDDDYTLIKHVISKLPENVTQTLMTQQSRGRQNTPLAIAVKTGNLGLVSLLLQTANASVRPTLLLRDVTGSIPLHSAILASNSQIVSLLAAAGPPEALYMENGVGLTPYEMAAYIALNATLRAQGSPEGCHTVYRSNPSQAQTVQGFSVWNYGGPTLDPQPGYKREDEAEIKSLRKVLDAVIAAGVLSKKPQLLEALTAFAAQAERDWEASKLDGGMISNEEQAPPQPTILGLPNLGISAGASWKMDTSDPTKTLEVFSKAVVPVHQRTLVHLKDVQEVVFNAVDNSEEKKRVEDDGGLVYEEEDVDNNDRSEFFLNGGVWQPKDYF
ncbi:hypothetical protein FRB98_009036 [Tulasnella sp. 332]|nr:hypothetical protein FRB98_009036 [Tulasnella sp. 332]